MHHTKKEERNKCRFVESNIIEPRWQVTENTARMFRAILERVTGYDL